MIFKNLGKDTVVYGGSDFLIKLIAFFTFPLIAATLSPRAFGVLELITTLIGLCGLFVNFGLNNAVQRFYWDEGMDDFQKAQLVSTGFLLQLGFWIILAFVLGIALVFVPDIIDLFDYGFTVTALVAAIFLIYIRQSSQYIQDTIRLHFAPFRFFAFSFLERVLTAIGALIVVVFLAGGIEGFLATQAVIGLLVLPLGLYMIRKDIGIYFDRQCARKIIGYGYPFIFTGLAYWLFSSMDRWMLSSMSSLEETGQYSVAFRFASLVFFVSTAFGQAWSPYAIKLKTDYPNAYRESYVLIFFMLIYIMLFIGGGLALFSGEIIGLIMPPEYAASAIPLAILSFAIIMQSTQQITASGISLKKKTKILATIAWAAALVNLVGNYIFIPLWGATGAAIATLLSYSFITISYLIFSQKLHYLPIKWRVIVGFALLGSCVLAVSIIFNTVEFDLKVVLSKVAFGVVFCVLGYLIFPFKKIFNEAKI